MHDIETFVLAAKSACYIGGGGLVVPSRQGTHEHGFQNGDLAYIDSYVGGTNFCGQEIVRHRGEPIWAMGYFGKILEPELLDGAGAGAIIKTALATMYRVEKRFLGGFVFDHVLGRYEDTNTGNFKSFVGLEAVFCQGIRAYELHYHGGTIIP